VQTLLAKVQIQLARVQIQLARVQIQLARVQIPLGEVQIQQGKVQITLQESGSSRQEYTGIRQLSTRIDFFIPVLNLWPAGFMLINQRSLIMATAAYMPNDDMGKVELMEHLAANLPAYAPDFNISAETLESHNADTKAFRYSLTMQHQVQSDAHNWTAHKNQLRDGGSGSAGWPVLTRGDEAPPPFVNPGVIRRLSTLVAGIKAHRSYTEAIGQHLRLIGPEILLEPDTWKPVLKSRFSAGSPVICWTKGQAGSIEIWADRGNGFALFSVNTEPDTIDTTPLPDTGTNWKYKAIYRLHDVPVGQWSDVMNVAVGV